MGLIDKILKCERCGHEWIPRKDKSQVRQCPSCKTVWWDTKKGETTKNC